MEPDANPSYKPREKYSLSDRLSPLVVDGAGIVFSSWFFPIIIDKAGGTPFERIRCVLNLAQNVKRAYSSAMNKERAYHSNPEILGGTLVFKGTRVPVQSLFDHLKAGDSIEDFLEGFPSVKRSQVLAVLKEMETEVLAHA